MSSTIDANRVIDKLKAQIGELAMAVSLRDIRIEELQEQLDRPNEGTEED